ncbi:MAG TPA: hypothetical protein PLE72_06575 [Azospira sp.]|nr:hypothetical protein [Azospira sp.]HNN08081.1 hypothetical protein [Azospira sp.]HNN45385.1 hypothetical protein [Azospira sp.]
MRTVRSWTLGPGTLLSVAGAHLRDLCLLVSLAPFAPFALRITAPRVVRTRRREEQRSWAIKTPAR